MSAKNQQSDDKMATVVISPVKRERLKKQERAAMKKKLRESLPVYTREEIRRYRLPLHEAIASELEELGLKSTATFMKDLIELQEKQRKSEGPDSKVWMQPRIIDRKDVLLGLSEGLKTAERAHYNGDLAGEIDQFLNLTVKYAFGSDDWWWLGRQIMQQCLEIAQGYEGDGRRRHAVIEYIAGKFYFEKIGDRRIAMRHLKTARIVSMGHSWTATTYLQIQQKTIFVESCILLYKLLLEDAKELMNDDPKEAIKLCVRAKRRAYDACVLEGEAQSMLLEGICHLLIGEITEAAHCFYKVLVMQTRANNFKEICETRIWLIKAYLKLGNWEESYANLQKLLTFGLENNLPYYVGQAYRYLGEYNLNHGDPSTATPLLLKAIDAFHAIGDIPNREQAKNLASVSSGQELIPQYIRLIVKSGRKGMSGWRSLQKLLAWKDSRKNVWTESEATISRMTVTLSAIRSGYDFGDYYGEEGYEEEEEEAETRIEVSDSLDGSSSESSDVMENIEPVITMSMVRTIGQGTKPTATKSVTIKLADDF